MVKAVFAIVKTEARASAIANDSQVGRFSA